MSERDSWDEVVSIENPELGDGLLVIGILLVASEVGVREVHSSDVPIIASTLLDEPGLSGLPGDL